MKHRLLTSAEDDYNAGISYYYGVSDELAGDFYEAVQVAFDDICTRPNAWPKDELDFRKYHLERFPYTVYYELCVDEIVIYTISPQSRDPDHWRDRIK